MVYYLDFDGTISDVWKRYYSVFCDASNISVSFECYKKNKIELQDDVQIIKKITGKSPNATFLQEYKDKKMKMLESYEYLSLDTLIVPSKKLLSFFSKNDAYILSMRRKPSNLEKQLEMLELCELVEKAIILPPEGRETKKNWLAKHEKREAFMVGDSEIDIVSGTLSNIRTIFCTSGLRGANPNLIKLADKTVKNLGLFLNA